MEPSTADEIPEWVPGAVRDVALRLPPSEIVRRLATDERMKSVWRTLSRQIADDFTVRVHLLYLEDASLDGSPILTRDDLYAYPPQERGATAFLAAAARILVGKPSLMTRAQLDAQARKFSDVANFCRKQCQRVGGQLKQTLADAADYFAYEAKIIKAESGPHVIERSAKERGDDVLRVKTRFVATAMFSLYGNRNLGTVASVVTIALGEKVLKKDVENWTRDIPAHFKKESQ